MLREKQSQVWETDSDEGSAVDGVGLEDLADMVALKQRDEQYKGASHADNRQEPSTSMCKGPEVDLGCCVWGTVRRAR